MPGGVVVTSPLEHAMPLLADDDDARERPDADAADAARRTIQKRKLSGCASMTSPAMLVVVTVVMLASICSRAGRTRAQRSAVVQAPRDAARRRDAGDQ